MRFAITREIMHQPALDKYRGREISPGVECQTDEQLDEFVRNHAETAFHPCGSCKMGYDEMAVVDGEGRVHGWKGYAWWMRRSCRRSSPVT
ncbi:choline dehydrogenase [Enterobacter cloacae]|uniref:Choline dehydrogenase n=1 Tax=Enterobacter cloacae TaxID=550 RepID=A0A377M7K8_ENTCL|nr:choline dehydrogenase [Enterobacter cloacae]